MFSQFNAYLQHIYPQHLLTNLAGKLANTTQPRLKNYLIQSFIRAFHIDMSTAQIEDPYEYKTFNDFFTRQLKTSLRPIAKDPYIACPADGVVSQVGQINVQNILQAKNTTYSLQRLLANDDELTQVFTDGSFATLYLAPHNYHRVHMPLTGELKKTIFVPGSLFSVNHLTAQKVPHLFARNERLISIFETEVGPMAIILVGAIIVGSIQTVWQNHPARAKTIVTQTFNNKLMLKKGDEMGLFKLGSTVIILFPKNRVEWSSTLQPGCETTYGSACGIVKNKA